jgi:hypothetical protein
MKGIKMKINGKDVDVHSIQIAGIYLNDYPDFADAYIEYAAYLDGIPLSDDELDALKDVYPVDIHIKIQEAVNYDGC